MIKDTLAANEEVKSNDKEMEVLHKYFPQCFTNEGKFDLEVFKKTIKEHTDITQEGYELNFLGKNYAKLLASIDTTTVIQPDLEHNSQPENANSENIYISGDNLDGLKHLLKSYAGQIKCIYIDPPYNTGTDGFVYNDNFNFSPEQLAMKLSISDEQAEKILDLTKRGSASHSAWLMFMCSRLLLARDLLKEDGVIFISIDDNEQANLKLLCDSVFGEENFVAELPWKGKGGGADNNYLMVAHEYILMFARNKESFVVGQEIKTNESFPKYDEVKKRYYKTALARKWGANSRRIDRPNLYYSVLAPDGTNVFPKLPDGEDGCWRWGMSTMNKQIEAGNVEFVKNLNDWIVYEKTYKPLEGKFNTKKYSTWFENYGNTANGTKEVMGLFENKKVFDYPKPTCLINELLKIANVQEDEIVVDFFSGAATTAHSVFQTNKDEKNRRFILIQLPEFLDLNNSSQKVAFDFLQSLNYPATLDYIGIERIKRAAKKIKEETGADIDYGFKHYTLVEPSDNTIDKLEQFDPKAIFADENILAQFGKETVLETWLVNDNYGFGAQPAPITLHQYTVYHHGKHLYFLDTELTEKDLVALVDRYNQDASFNPENIVLFGYSFTFTEMEMLRNNLIVLKDSAKNLKLNIETRY